MKHRRFLALCLAAVIALPFGTGSLSDEIISDDDVVISDDPEEPLCQEEASVEAWMELSDEADVFTDEEVIAGEEALFAAKGTFTKLPDGTPLDAEFCLDLKKKEIHVAGEVFAFADISDIAMVKTNRLLFTADGGYYEIFSDSAVLRPYLMAVLFDNNHREGK